MTVSETTKNTDKSVENQLFLEFPWFYENIFFHIQNSIFDFFQYEYSFRFMGVSCNDNNILFFGDEYFVNKIPVNKSASLEVRISSGVISSLLENSLGASDFPFSIDKLTDVEALLIKSFTVFMYKKIEGLLIKTEPNKKILKKSKIYNFTFYIRYENKHIGKVIISIPDYTLNDNIAIEFREECFDISNFENTISALVTLRVGAARISLNDIKNIETGDVIMLDESDVNKMAILWEGNLIDFNITPNPALIISVDKTGGDEMDNDYTVNNEKMWDTILVDVVAEFDNFKLTLGELKQISEGLVIDVGSVYENKVKLRVAKQVVASGELVILNDRYGVRIDNVKNSDEVEYEEAEEDEDAESEAPQPAQKTAPQKPKQPAQKVKQQNNANSPENTSGDENFNYSDFEIEDESI